MAHLKLVLHTTADPLLLVLVATGICEMVYVPTVILTRYTICQSQKYTLPNYRNCC